MEYLPLADHLLHIDDGRLKVMDRKTPEKATDDLLQDLRERVSELVKAKFYEDSADVTR
jgi:hypothetical protein